MKPVPFPLCTVDRDYPEWPKMKEEAKVILLVVSKGFLKVIMVQDLVMTVKYSELLLENWECGIKFILVREEGSKDEVE